VASVPCHSAGVFAFCSRWGAGSVCRRAWPGTAAALERSSPPAARALTSDARLTVLCTTVRIIPPTSAASNARVGSSSSSLYRLPHVRHTIYLSLHSFRGTIHPCRVIRGEHTCESRDGTPGAYHPFPERRYQHRFPAPVLFVTCVSASVRGVHPHRAPGAACHPRLPPARRTTSSIHRARLPRDHSSYARAVHLRHLFVGHPVYLAPGVPATCSATRRSRRPPTVTCPRRVPIAASCVPLIVRRSRLATWQRSTLPLARHRLTT